MLGRVMSLVMLAMLGVQPVSTAVAGAVIGLGAQALFVGCGAGVLVVAAVAWMFRRSWSLDALEADMPLAAEGAA
jgi:cellobiose-specific phosphotransferase system component IIC